MSEKINNIHSEVAYFPKEVYDSDGEGPENWSDDTEFDAVSKLIPYENEVEYDSSRNSEAGGLKSVEFLKRFDQDEAKAGAKNALLDIDLLEAA